MGELSTDRSQSLCNDRNHTILEQEVKQHDVQLQTLFQKFDELMKEVHNQAIVAAHHRETLINIQNLLTQIDARLEKSERNMLARRDERIIDGKAILFGLGGVLIACVGLAITEIVTRKLGL